MASPVMRCAVCDEETNDSTLMSKVVVEGRTLDLCRSHAAMVVTAMPRTFEELRSLFVGVSDEAWAQGSKPWAERRSPIDRRNGNDRRVFPPRPEGRRLSPGRRATDPRE